MVNINKRVYDKIFNYAKQSGSEEIGGLLLGRIQRDGKCLITKAILLKQIRTILGFEIDDDYMMEFTKTSNERTLKSVIGWWHSHGFHDAEWSPDDDRTFTRLCNFLNGFCVGVVVTIGRKKATFRVDIKHKSGRNLTVDNITPCILGNFKINNILSAREVKEIADKVTTDPRVEVNWDPCPRCDGSGLVFRKKYGNEQVNQFGEIIENPSLIRRMF